MFQCRRTLLVTCKVGIEFFFILILIESIIIIIIIRNHGHILYYKAKKFINLLLYFTIQFNIHINIATGKVNN
jgi:hypothetical protein